MYQEVWDQKITLKSQLPLPSRSPSLYEKSVLPLCMYVHHMSSNHRSQRWCQMPLGLELPMVVGNRDPVL